MAIEVDLEGKVPIPGWKVVACLVLAAMMMTAIAADLLGVLPRSDRGTVAAVDRMEQKINRIKNDQEDLRSDQENLRSEMRAGFAEIRRLIEKREK